MHQRRSAGWTLAVIGVVLFGVQVAHGLQQFDAPAAVFVDVVPFAVAGLAVAYAGYWLVTEEAVAADAGRVLAWAVGGALVLASVAALMLFNRNVAGGTLDRAAYVAVDNVTVGVLGGALVGLYDARSRERMRDLRAERDRVAAFARKAADVNNYGQAISAADDVEAVAAYTVEGVTALTSVGETGVVELGDGEVTVLGATWPGLDDEAAREVARRGLEGPDAGAVFHDDGPAALLDGADQFLTAVVAERGGDGVVLVAVPDGEGDVAEEDLQLLELLVSHASAALDRISHERTRTIR